MEKYIDIHTHKTSFSGEHLHVQNCFPETDTHFLPGQYYSVGIHPWYINNFEQKFLALKKISEKKEIIAIGEIGLDKLKPDFENQKVIFESQLFFAEKIKKPVVIHCVKAFNELIEIIKKNKISVPLIFHRYGGNSQLTDVLMTFDSYFSFGDSVFSENPSTLRMIKKIPIPRMFFETDDSSSEIQDIYSKAALLKGVDVENLKKQIYYNFISIFGSQLHE